MTEPGERPASGTTAPPARSVSGWARLRPHTLPVAIIEALAAALLAALAWALVKGILESPGVLAIALVGGWAIGAVLWQVRAARWLALAIAALAWLVGLLLTWLVAMAILPSSSRTFLERVDGTPFIEWLSPQFGFIEVVGLLLYLAAAAYGSRSRS